MWGETRKHWELEDLVPVTTLLGTCFVHIQPMKCGDNVHTNLRAHVIKQSVTHKKSEIC